MHNQNKYNILEISQFINATFLQKNSDSSGINEIIIDSRSQIITDKAIFFALKTQRNDGHNYIEDVYNKGIRNFVVDNPKISLSNFPEANFLLVENSLKALQTLAAEHRKSFDIPIIGITGSNGKTVVKEWLFQLLKDDFNIVRSPKSYNSQLGVPLSVWQINNENTLGIFEAGISQTNEMQKLRDIINPTIGIFTNIGTSHQVNFKTISEKTDEKMKLFQNAKKIIFCSDFDSIKKSFDKLKLKNADIEAFNWSKKDKNAQLFISEIVSQQNFTKISAIYLNNKISIKIPFVDNASIENAINCWCLLLLLNYNTADISNKTEQLHNVAMRLELKQGINNCTIINDSYSNDFNSLVIALDFLNQQNQHSNKTIILSDILQTDENPEKLYSDINKLLILNNVSNLIGIGKQISNYAEVFTINKTFFTTTKDFIKYYNFQNFQNQCILCKGARSFYFEDISEILQQKKHETILEINVNSLIDNLNYFRSLLKPNVKTMVMVKAFSYGSGSYEIANALQFHQVDYLAVAFADEGVELRKAGITLPIMVMNSEVSSYDFMIKYNLEPEIFSLRSLDTLINTLNNEESDKIIGIHIKIDTGMHRLGFLPAQINEVIKKIKSCKQIKIKSVFSHLVGSDDPKFDEFTKTQLSILTEVANSIQSEFNYKILKHISNSSAILRFNDANLDMVRLGIGLYGISPIEQHQKHLQNVSSLKTIISQIKTINPGETVGYNRNFTAQKQTKVATLPIGYADGIRRSLGNGKAKVYIKNTAVPIIGNICMDMMMIDITNVDANEGDEVKIFFSAETIMQLSEWMETIPYELLTGISQRVKRIYYQE